MLTVPPLLHCCLTIMLTVSNAMLCQLVDDTSQTQPSGSSDGSVSYLPLGRQTSLATCSAPAMVRAKSSALSLISYFA